METEAFLRGAVIDFKLDEIDDANENLITMPSAAGNLRAAWRCGAHVLLPGGGWRRQEGRRRTGCIKEDRMLNVLIQRDTKAYKSVSLWSIIL